MGTLTATSYYRAVVTSGVCQFSNSDTISISVNPQASVNAGNDQTICAGTSVILAGTFDGAATSATWSSGGSGDFTIDSTLYIPSQAEITTGLLYLYLTTNNPVGPCPEEIDTLQITINSSEFVTANITDTAVCHGQELTLAGTGDGVNYFIWSGGILDSVPFVPTVSSWYQVTGYVSSECFDDDFVYVEVLPSPTFDLPADTIACSGVQIQFSNNTSSDTTMWNWDNIITSPSITITPNSTGYLTYQINNQFNCQKSDSILIEVIQTPTPQITGQNIVCQNAYNISYSLENWNNNALTWHAVNGELMGYNGTNMLVHWYNDTATTELIVTETIWGSSCQGTDTLEITLESSNALDPAQIQPLYNGSSVLYSSLDYPIMIWGFEPKATNMETVVQNQSNQYCEFGFVDTVNYYYWVKIAENDSSCLTKSYYNAPVLTSDISEVDSGNHLVTIYPNPAVEVLNIRNDGDDKIELILSDQAGRIIDQLFISGNTTRIINISEFESGYYYFHYSIGGIRSTKKFIKF
jgi:hypothetical protein